jgi:drug/metabolite transporter (DMT)-like permease
VSFLGEHPGLAHLLAFGCAAAGVALVTWPGRRAGTIPE